MTENEDVKITLKCCLASCICTPLQPFKLWQKLMVSGYLGLPQGIG